MAKLMLYDFPVSTHARKVRMVADIAAFCDLAFQKLIGVEIDPKNHNLIAWLARMEARPSSKA